MTDTAKMPNDPLLEPIPAASLESIVCTDELQRRPWRPPDHEKENRALVALASALADSPRTILQTLADKVCEVLDADSSGLSMLTTDQSSFLWPAVAGAWRPHIGAGAPRNFAPCGVVLDHNHPMLFTHWERRYPYLGGAIPLAEEGLIVPFYVNGKGVGTIWAVAHDHRRKFDAEDLRLLESMGRFASAAYQAVQSIDNLKLENAAREKAETVVRELANELEAQVRVRTEELERSTRELLVTNEELEREIAERKRAEDELRRSEALLAEGQRLTSTGTFSWRLDTDEITLSGELRRMYELDQDTAPTMERLLGLIHPEDIPALAEKQEQIRADHAPYEHDLRLRMPDGRVKYLRTFGRLIRHENGRLESLGATQDVTQRRLVEEALDRLRSELAHVTRVTSLGALTASIAHEVNQPLSGIITNASTCLRMLDADPPNVDGARETARRAIRDGNRASDVVTRLRALFSKKEFTMESLDLNEATREVIALSMNDLQRNRVLLESELADDLPGVTGDRVQLQQVIMNLLRNASDAMVGVDDRPRRLLVRTEREKGDRVRVTVQDVGLGVDPQSMDKLFDAFYTTKAGGMGIGLSVSRSIVERHHGRLWAEPNDGPGATFSFAIPCRPERLEDAKTRVTQTDRATDAA